MAGQNYPTAIKASWVLKILLFASLHLSHGLDRVALTQSSTSSLGSSSGLVLSSNADWALFGSTSQNLTQHRYTPATVNIFSRSAADGSLKLVTQSFDSSSAGNGSSINYSITPDGKYAVFQSEASNLVLNDTNNLSDIFVRTLPDGPTVLCSSSTSINLLLSGSRFPSITPDGRFVIYEKFYRSFSASPSYWNIYLRNLETGAEELISRARTGISSAPAPQIPDSLAASISADGRYVVFQSAASNMIANDSNGRTDIFLRDRQLQTTIAVSVTPTFAVGNAASYAPIMSADGRWVVFISEASNLVPNTPSGANLYFRDNLNSVTVRAPFGSTGGTISDLSMTPDGHFVLFSWRQTLQLWNTQSSTLQQVGAQGNSEAASMSDDGSKIAFLSVLGSSEPVVLTQFFQLWLRDRTAGTLTLLSQNFSKTGPGSNDCRLPIISAGGRFVGFDTPDSNLVPGDTNRASDVFLAETETRTITSLSLEHGLPSSPPLRALHLADMTPDGKVILFLTDTPINPGDTNLFIDAYVYNTTTREFILASAINAQDASGNGAALTALLSRNGDKVVFTSRGTNFGGTDTNQAVDIYLRNLTSRETTLISLALGGEHSAAKDSTNVVLSADGNSVAFISAANDLVEGHNTGKADVFVRNLISGAIIAPGPPAAVAVKQIAVSPNGRFVLFADDDLSLADLTAGTQRVIAPAGSTIPINSFTVDNARLLYSQSGNLTLYQISDQSILPLCTACDQPFFSGDGKFAAYRAITGVGTNRAFHVWRHEFSTQNKLLISQDLSPALFWNPKLNEDASAALFSSSAPSILKRAAPAAYGQVYRRDFTLNQTIRISQGSIFSFPNSHSTTPLFSADGNTVAFVSFASNLAADDKNAEPDIFIYQQPADTDFDGLPDEWEVAYFGNLQSTPTDDPDSDGASNFDEFRAGTNPSSDSSLLSVTILRAILSERVVISWDSVLGKRYQVESTSDVSLPWEALGNPVEASSPATSVAYAAPNIPPAFYRVRLLD
jgi:hypothetical protein